MLRRRVYDMMTKIDEISPLLKARIAGAFYLLCILTGIYAATIATGRLSLAANLVGTAFYVVVTLILYDLLKPVNKSVSLLAALFSLVGCTVSFLRFLHLPSPGINALVFFGFYCLLLAYLVFRSTFLPRLLSALLLIAGLGWLTFLSPPLGDRLFPILMITGLAGEGSLTLWLLVFGVDAQRWREQARAAAQRPT
jgi:uncharacterized protein DUF4386